MLYKTITVCVCALLSADPKQPITIIDKKGNTQTFNNVKEINIKEQTETKKDTTAATKKETSEKLIDNSTINETNESVSDANNFKGIAIAIACSIFFGLVIYLVFKFKK